MYNPFRRKASISRYHFALRTAAHFSDMLDVVIVGANDGKINDPAFELLTGDLADRTSVTLIEPHTDLIPYLRRNYEPHPRHEIINRAIGADGTIELHSVAPEIWGSVRPRYAKGWPDYRAPTGVTSANRDHVVKWAKAHLRGDKWADEFVISTSIPCGDLASTLASAGKKPSVDVLQVDAEGEDDAVLRACNLDSLKPSILFFEAMHIPKHRFASLEEYLRGLGYLIEIRDGDAICLAA